MSDVATETEQVAEATGAPAAEATEQNPEKASGWAATLRPDQQSHELAKKFSKNPDFFDDYVKLNEKVQKSIAIPGEGATPEEWEAYYAKLGRPESPDGYELSEGESANEEFTEWYKQQAHKLGLSANQARALFESFDQYSAEQQKESQASIQRANEKAVNALRREYGDEFEPNVAGARRVAQRIGGSEFVELMNEVGQSGRLGDDPRMIRAMVNIYKMVAEDNLVAGSPKEEAPRAPGEYRYPSM